MKNAAFQKKLHDSKKPVIVDLWAPWCRPCRAMEPAFKQAGEKYAGRVEVLKINADEAPEVLKGLGVMSIPTVIAFSGGKEILRRTGLQSTEALDMLFDAALNNRKPNILPPAPIDRVIRTVAGGGVLIFAAVNGFNGWLIALGAALLFSAFYDRCPIFKAVFPRVKALFIRAD